MGHSDAGLWLEEVNLWRCHVEGGRFVPNVPPYFSTGCFLFHALSPSYTALRGWGGVSRKLLCTGTSKTMSQASTSSFGVLPQQEKTVTNSNLVGVFIIVRTHPRTCPSSRKHPLFQCAFAVILIKLRVLGMLGEHSTMELGIWAC